jgi:hypothetical protein
VQKEECGEEDENLAPTDDLNVIADSESSLAQMDDILAKIDLAVA